MLDEQNQNGPVDENFFEKMENAPPRFPIRKFERSRTNVMLTGVCAGIANYFNADVANVRLIALLSLLLGGWSAVAYLIIASLMPAEINPSILTGEETDSMRKENFRILLGGILILVGFYFALQKIGLSDGGRIFIFPNSFVMPVFSVVFGSYLLFSRKEPDTITELNRPAPAFKRSRRHRMLTGVCGGLAGYFNSDPGSIRIIFIIITMLSMGLFAAAYVVISIQTKMEETDSNEI